MITILFTDSERKPQDLLFLDYRPEEHLGELARKPVKGRDYAQAYLLRNDGFEREPFWIRRPGEEGFEWQFATEALPPDALS